MNRAAVLDAFASVTDLEEIIVPKSGGSSKFAVTNEGLYWQPAGIGDEYKVGKDSAAQALRHVPGLSASAINEWPTQLLLEPLNWWHANGDGNVRALVNSQGEVISFTKKADAGVHSMERQLEAVEEGMVEKGVDLETVYYDKVRVGLDRASFAVVTSENKAAEVKVGDMMNAGVIVFGSPTGEAHTEVSPFLNRLACTNGMVSPVAMGRYSHRGGDGGNLFDWTKEFTLQAWDAIDGELEALRGLTEVEVDGNVHNVMADLFERHHVPARLREQITEAAVEEADGTMFGIAQAFNRVANTQEDVAGLRHLMMVTGDVAHQTDRCSACLRVVN